jgi:hypothetical protein
VLCLEPWPASSRTHMRITEFDVSMTRKVVRSRSKPSVLPFNVLFSRCNSAPCPVQPTETHWSPETSVSYKFRACFWRPLKFGQGCALFLDRDNSRSSDCWVRRTNAWLWFLKLLRFSEYSSPLRLNLSRLYSCLKRFVSVN